MRPSRSLPSFWILSTALILGVCVQLQTTAAAAASLVTGPVHSAADLYSVASVVQTSTTQAALDQLQPQLGPRQQQQQQLSLLQEHRPYVVAHRGASGPLPEHTIAAYQRAIEQGADFIECDVVMTKDLALICRHEPNLNDTTDAWERFGDRAASYLIDGELMSGIFASDLTLAEVKQLRAKQRWPFRSHAFDGRYGIVTFEEFIDLALSADRPVGIYPESKHPTWHNQLPTMQAAHTTLEHLMVEVLHAKGYATSAPHGSRAWRLQPIYIQSFEVTSLQRFAALTPVPLALLLDKGTAPDTGLTFDEMMSDTHLSQLAAFVTVMAPWKALLYTLVDKHIRPVRTSRNSTRNSGLALPSAATAAGGGEDSMLDSSRRLMITSAESGPGVVQGLHGAPAAGLSHPDVPLSREHVHHLQATQQLQTTGLTARLHRHGFQVHTYTLRDEPQFVLPTCKQGIVCEFEWLFASEGLDGAFADWPGTMADWLQQYWHA